MEARIIDKAAYLRIGRFDIWFEWMPYTILRLEIDLPEEIAIICLVGLELRIVWSGEKGKIVAEEALRQTMAELKEMFKSG